jgi:hypothetical protein
LGQGNIAICVVVYLLGFAARDGAEDGYGDKSGLSYWLKPLSTTTALELEGFPGL